MAQIYAFPTSRKANRPIWSPELEPVEMEIAAMQELPLLGVITAGLPIEAIETGETVSVPANMVRKASYALRVRGHSMIEDNIQDGDIVLIEQRQSAANGESVVARINGDQVTLKKLYIEADGIRLQPANPDMTPIYLRHEQLEILGIVSGVIRQS